MTDSHVSEAEGAEALERVPTGIERLDYILKGGFIKGNAYSIFGRPGSGKTIFGNQLCFNHIRKTGGSCVYLTLLVEPHTKIIRHLRPMKFFDEGLVPDRMYYISGYAALREDGHDGLLSLARKTVRERNANILIVDGIEGLDHSGSDDRGVREFFNELQAMTSLAGCTLLMLSSDRARSQMENSVVDGIIELSDKLVGPRAVRELTVHKFRGSDYLRGRHEVEITDSGIVIHPRTEIQFDDPPARATEERVRMGFGIQGLDEMLVGGVPSGSTLAVLGAPGSGKTTLGLSFLIEGARQGQHGHYFGFYEPPPRLMEKAASLGLPLRKYVDDGLITIDWQPPLEHLMDALSEQLLERLRATPKQRQRLFIDGVEGFRAASVYPDRLPRFLSALTNQLRMLDVTTLLSEELPLFKPEVEMATPELAHVVETIVLLRYVELDANLHRLLSIMKMRESRYDTSLREFFISDAGIQLCNTFDSAASILTGHPRPSGRVSRRPGEANDE